MKPEDHPLWGEYEKARKELGLYGAIASQYNARCGAEARYAALAVKVGIRDGWVSLEQEEEG